MSFLRLALFSTLTVSALASGPAGNENYQAHARSQVRSLSALNKLSARDNLSPIDILLEQTSYTFKIYDGAEDKVYISPAGDKHKKYSLALTGLASLKTKASSTVVPITVFDVGGQKEITCDSMGNAVSSYLSSDDVWTEVSLRSSVPIMVLEANHLSSINPLGFHEEYAIKCSSLSPRLAEGFHCTLAILFKSNSAVSFSADLHDCLSTHWGTSAVLSTVQTQGNLQGIDVKVISTNQEVSIMEVSQNALCLLYVIFS